MQPGFRRPFFPVPIPTLPTVEILMVALAGGLLAGCMASSPPSPVTTQGPSAAAEGADDARPEAPSAGPVQRRIGKAGFVPPAPPEGIVGIAVPAVVSEPAAVYVAPRKRQPENLVMTEVPTPQRFEPRPMAWVEPDLGVTAQEDGTDRRLQAPAPKAAPFSNTFDSLDFDDNIPNTGGSIFIPPDPIGAAGPDHVVSVVNVSIQFHTKAGTELLDAVPGLPVTGVSLASFFAPLAPVNATFDPKVIYDQHADRFLVVTLEKQDTGNPLTDDSRILLAVSKNSDPTDTWYLTSIPSKLTFFNPLLGTTVNHWADYPGFSVDEEAVYITNNMFSFSESGAIAFGGTRLWIVDKFTGAGGGFYGGGTATVSLFDPYAGGGFAMTTQPAHVFGTAPTAPTNVGTWLSGFNGLTGSGVEFLQVIRVDDPIGPGPTTFVGPSNVNMGNIDDLGGPPLPDAPQSGSTELIETNDRRTLHSVWRDNQLYATTTIDPEVGDPNDGQATAHWVQLDTTVLGSPALADQGDVGGEDIAVGTYTFFPSVAVTSAGDVAIGFSAAAASIFPSSAYTTRAASDPAGSNTGSVLLRPGLDFYIRTFDSAPCAASPARNRWGDYSGTALDPVDECFWIYNQHAILRGTGTTGGCNGRPATEDGRWGTAFGRACVCSETFSLTTGQWKQISLACAPGAADTVDDLFGDDLGGTYDVNWVVHERDATNQTYVKKALTDPLEVGRGYWIKTNLSSQSVTAEGIDNGAVEVALVSDTTDGAGCATSAGRCNKVGHPFKLDVCWADVEVIDGASTLSLSAADPAGACQGANAAANGCVMSRIAHKWTGASYAPFDGVTPGMEGTLVPWDGFWVSAVKSGVKLRVPATGGNCGAPALAGPNGWFIRLIAESGDLRDAGNVLGQLSDSNRGYDSHDLPELPPFDSPFLTVVFPHDDWGGHAADYASDYHLLRPESVPDPWSFEVRSSDPGAEVTLRWEGPDARLVGSVLTDLETGQRVEVLPDGSYTFVLSGTSRSFQWVTQEASSGIFADGFESGGTSAWSGAVGE